MWKDRWNKEMLVNSRDEGLFQKDLCFFVGIVASFLWNENINYFVIKISIVLDIAERS